MTPSLTHVMLLLLVAMAAAAPVAEQASGQEQVVNILGDSNAVDRGLWFVSLSDSLVIL